MAIHQVQLWMIDDFIINFVDEALLRFYISLGFSGGAQCNHTVFYNKSANS